MACCKNRHRASWQIKTSKVSTMTAASHRNQNNKSRLLLLLTIAAEICISGLISHGILPLWQVSTRLARGVGHSRWRKAFMFTRFWVFMVQRWPSKRVWPWIGVECAHRLWRCEGKGSVFHGVHGATVLLFHVCNIWWRKYAK